MFELVTENDDVTNCELVLIFDNLLICMYAKKCCPLCLGPLARRLAHAGWAVLPTLPEAACARAREAVPKIAE